MSFGLKVCPKRAQHFLKNLNFLLLRTMMYASLSLDTKMRKIEYFMKGLNHILLGCKAMIRHFFVVVMIFFVL